MKYKIGKEVKINDIIIWIDKKFSNRWKKEHGVSIYKKIAKIIDITKDKYGNSYLLQFKEKVCNFQTIKNKDKISIGKSGHCFWIYHLDQIELYKDFLKLKKFVKHGV